MIRSVTTSEVEWDDDERADMLALTRCEHMTCTGCNGWLPDTLTMEAEQFDVPPPSECGKCKAIAIHQDYRAKETKHMHVLRWNATLRR